MKLKEKIALSTGASGGIGAAIAEEMVERRCGRHHKLIISEMRRMPTRLVGRSRLLAKRCSLRKPTSADGPR